MTSTRIVTTITDEMKTALDEVADEKGVKVADLVRQALNDLLEVNGKRLTVTVERGGHRISSKHLTHMKPLEGIGIPTVGRLLNGSKIAWLMPMVGFDEYQVGGEWFESDDQLPFDRDVDAFTIANRYVLRLNDVITVKAQDSSEPIGQARVVGIKLVSWKNVTNNDLHLVGYDNLEQYTQAMGRVVYWMVTLERVDG